MLINNMSEGLEVSAKVSETIINSDGSTEASANMIVKEHFIDLYINDQLAAKLVCTPKNLSEMIIGRMKTEGYIDSIDDVESLYICEYGSRARVFLKNKNPLERSLEQEPTCCTGNQIFLSKVNGEHLKKLESVKWEKEWIFRLANAFVRESRIHKATQGTHCCYLSIAGEILYSAEDIGRHNAMDKAIGYALMNRLDLSRCILYTTGRVPTDMVKKAVGAGIPILVSKAVPTDQAIEMAEYYNLTLICKAWPDRFEIFHSEQSSSFCSYVE